MRTVQLSTWLISSKMKVNEMGSGVDEKRQATVKGVRGEV